MSGIVAINQEFTDRRTVTMGVASTGGSIGTLVLPILTSRLIDIYNWRDSFILLGGLCLQGVVASVLLYSARKKVFSKEKATGKMYFLSPQTVRVRWAVPSKGFHDMRSAQSLQRLCHPLIHYIVTEDSVNTLIRMCRCAN